MKSITITLFFFLSIEFILGQDSLRLDTIYQLVSVNIRAIQPVTGEYLSMADRVLKLSSAQQTGDLLLETGNVFIQKSQTLGGSPIIRGFEANKIGISVDGIRFNNLIFRGGHQHYISLINPYMLDNIRVLQGPQSVNYGTDAIGGVLEFETKKLTFAGVDDRSIIAKARGIFQYEDATNSNSQHFDLNIGLKKWAFLGGITITGYGTMRMGANKNPFGDYIGALPYKRKIINGIDSIAVNNDSLEVPLAETKLRHFSLKVGYQQNKNVLHQFSVMSSSLGVVHRNDRLSELKNGKYVFNIWQYSPTNWFMGYHKLTLNLRKKYLNHLQITSHIQRLKEGRETQKSNNSLQDNRYEKVNIFSIVAKAETRELGFGGLKYGLEFRKEKNASEAYRTFANDPTLLASTLDTRYPDGGSILISSGVFLSHEYEKKFENGSEISFQTGLRFDYQSLKSIFLSKEFFNFPFNEISITKPAFAGHFLTSFNASNGWFVQSGLSTAYRIPNVDDLGKIFESTQGKVIIPNEQIKPEQSVQIEVEGGRRFSSRTTLSGSLYYTYLFNALALKEYNYQGNDSILYNGLMNKVYAMQNFSNAKVFGASLYFKTRLAQWWRFQALAQYTQGTLKTGESLSPLDHIPPIFGKVSLGFDKGRLETYLDCLFNGEKPIAKYAINGEDNAQYALKTGTPAWVDLRWRIEFAYKPNIRIAAGLNNLLDTQYRVFASGVNAPGRSFWIRLTLGF